MVRTYCQILWSGQFKSSINHLHLIVDVLCSAPAFNTCSKKRNILFQNGVEDLHDDSINIQYFFALPNSLNDDTIIQVIQQDTTCYNLQELDEQSVVQWKEMKKNKVRKQQMKRIRNRAETLKKLKRELRQCHKLSQTESGYPGVCWWHMKYWEGDMGLKVKREELTPQLLQSMANMGR